MPNPEQILSELGFQLPPPPAAGGNYLPSRRVGNLLYLAGVISVGPDGLAAGKVGDVRSLEDGYAAAQLCGLNALANIKDALGSLEAVECLVFMSGYVNAVDGFAESPQVINGASDLFAKVFGEAGRHARAAVAVAGLPKNATVEIQVVCQVKGGTE